MRHIIVLVEQLDRAAEDLCEGSLLSGRTALILTDNVIELLVHHRCEFIFDVQATYPQNPIEGGRYSRANRHRVVQSHYDEKLKFLIGEGLLSEIEYSFVRHAHRIRNIAYHAGLTHDDILLPLAWEMHSFACDLLVRYKSGGRVIPVNAKIPPRYMKHLPESHRDDSNRAFFPNIEEYLAASLNDARPLQQSSLQSALAGNISHSVGEIEKIVSFINRNAGGGKSVPDILKDAQWWYDMFKDIPVEIEEHTDAYTKFIEERDAKMQEDWKPDFDKLPIDSWRRRIRAISQAAPRNALNRYMQLAGEVDSISRPLNDAARERDGFLELRFEQAREERGS